MTHPAVATAPTAFTQPSTDVNQSVFTRILIIASQLDRVAMGMLRLGLVVVLVWIGGLKFANYEADSIVPLVANSPLTSFLYQHQAPEYRHYLRLHFGLGSETKINSIEVRWPNGNIQTFAATGIDRCVDLIETGPNLRGRP